MDTNQNYLEEDLAELEGMTCFSLEQIVERSLLGEMLHHLVLESNPQPDYYAKSHFPPNQARSYDRRLMLPIKKGIACFQDEVYRKACDLTRQIGDGISIYPGQMTYQNEMHQCIRINTKTTDHLPQIVDELEKLGLQFFSDRKVEPYNSFIYYKRFTGFTRLMPNVYHDNTTLYRYFFRVNGNVGFQDFQKGIEQIKNSCQFYLFDSFLASLFFRNQVIDFVGVYSEHCETERLVEFKNEVKKIFG